MNRVSYKIIHLQICVARAYQLTYPGFSGFGLTAVASMPKSTIKQWS